jgi:peptidyl carrier protein
MTRGEHEVLRTGAEIKDKVRRFIVAKMLRGDGRGLQDDTDLLTSAVLDSFASLELVVFLREEFGIDIGLGQVTPANLRTIDAIGRMVERALAGAGALQPGA